MEPLLGMDFDGAPPHRCALSRKKKKHEKGGMRKEATMTAAVSRCFPSASFFTVSIFAFHSFSLCLSRVCEYVHCRSRHAIRIAKKGIARQDERAS